MLDRARAFPHSTPGSPPFDAFAPPLPRIDSRRLLEGGRELVIDHEGQQYRLRLTRNGKLILTK